MPSRAMVSRAFRHFRKRSALPSPRAFLGKEQFRAIQDAFRSADKWAGSRPEPTRAKRRLGKPDWGSARLWTWMPAILAPRLKGWRNNYSKGKILASPALFHGYPDYSSLPDRRTRQRPGAASPRPIATMTPMDVSTSDGIAFADVAPPATALAALPHTVASWFARRYGEPTVAQRIAWPVFSAGHNLLLSAPTGTGKTLAAFLPLLGEMFEDLSAPRSPWNCLTRSVRCLYVAPLKALNNDAFRSLTSVVEEFSAFMADPTRRPRLGVRTGDTPDRERRSQTDDPPDILLTTPESLAVLLSGPQASRLFSGLRHVVIDEVHAILPTKRGADLALSLERLELLVDRPLRRIGLSATAAPLEVVARFLVGEGRSCAIGSASEPAPLELTYRPLEGGPGFLRQLVTTLEPELRENRATLLFTNARGLAERLAWALRHAMTAWDNLIAVHHSALAAERRREVEGAFKRGELRAVVSSTSLELGIDIGSVDLVVLVHPPGDVVRLLQRVGRAGHGPGRVKRGLVITASAAELLEAVVTGTSGRSAQCETLRVPERPLDVLCQQLLGMACAATCDPDAVFATVRRAAPYRALDRKDFDDCLAYLFGLDRHGQPWLPARLAGCVEGFTVRDARTARLLRRNLGSILAEETTTVRQLPREECVARDDRCQSAWGPGIPIGEVDHPFAETLQPGDRFLLDGRCLEVRRLEAGTLLVDEVAGRPAVPRWPGDGWPLSTELAGRLYSLRVRAAEALRDGLAALAELLEHDYGLCTEAAEVLAEYFERQETLSEIPDRDGILIEAVGSQAAVELYVHTPLNRLANDALARVAIRRLVRDHGRAADSVVADLGFALLIRGRVTTPIPDLVRSLLGREGFAADLEAALVESPALRERFQRVATTGLMLLRNPQGRRRRVGGRDWGERQLFDRVREHDPDFVLLRQAMRELGEERCDAEAARGFVETLPLRALKCRWLSRPSPFTEGWTQLESGASEEAESPAEALRRLHAILTGSGTTDARAV
jgi:ATP-dependent helicase Lhr and Lhr-like helicase